MPKDGNLSTTSTREKPEQESKKPGITIPDLPSHPDRDKAEGEPAGQEPMLIIGRRLEAGLTQEIEDYKRSGGVIQFLPPGEPEKAKASTSKGPAIPATGYAREPISKADFLGQRLNLSAQNMENAGGGGGGKPKIERQDIYAALAMAKLKQAEADLYIYFWTQDENSRGGAWALLMCWLADQKIAQGWETRKRGLLIGMVETALDQITNPVKYRTFSGRAYSRAIGAANNNTWKKYEPRYAELLAYIETILQKGDRALQEQL